MSSFVNAISSPPASPPGALLAQTQGYIFQTIAANGFWPGFRDYLFNSGNYLA